MNMNGWVASSQRVYRWLLRLYPQDYRTAYGMEMFHVFTAQCREAHKGQGRWGILSLWSRTLADVIVTVIREHLSDPHARVGLLEATPNAPLPWKGVLLVLIPGLIFFVSQIEQVISNNDWFYFVFYRAGYFLILPVLLVWVWTRRFPVWGLIPLGLLYATLWEYVQRFQLESLPFIGKWFARESIELVGTELSIYAWRYLFTSMICLILLGILLRVGVQRGQISRTGWIWLGVYGSLFVLRIVLEGYRSFSSWWVSPEEMNKYLFETSLWLGYTSLPFLLLVFIGMLFARKYEGFSFLMLLGYLLPIVIFGRYGVWNDYIPFYVVSLTVVAYRFIVALIAPVWLVRAAAIPSRQRAAAIPVAIAILCHLFLSVITWKVIAMSRLDLILIVWDPLMTAAGLGLAVALYLPGGEDRTVLSPPAVSAAAE
ncbi:MAG TPA: hypothetical protein VFQ13_03285 [Anaerolineales bacterium]|nr:hypothetical protein [Anaerolineales bacterium]